jgi:hypothetical protein
MHGNLYVPGGPSVRRSFVEVLSKFCRGGGMAEGGADPDLENSSCFSPARQAPSPKDMTSRCYPRDPFHFVERSQGAILETFSMPRDLKELSSRSARLSLRPTKSSALRYHVLHFQCFVPKVKYLRSEKGLQRNHIISQI